MSLPTLRLAGVGELAHPAVARRRRQGWLVAAFATGLPLALALGIALSVPDPNVLLALGIIAGLLGVAALAASVRYEVTLTILALYLGCVDGVVKLTTNSQAVSTLRDVMIAAICVGALARLVVRREQVRLPPLTAWVLVFVLLVLAMAFNPETAGLTKALGGFRQQLEWIPFFFFGYLLMRSKKRLRGFFLLLGVIALANGIVGSVQTQLTPAELSSWGPGYAERISGEGSVAGRVYTDEEGTQRVRPPALGSDEGFGGFVAIIALPGLLALLAAGRLRGKWLAIVLALGAMVAVATSAQRLAVVGAVLAILTFVVLSASAGRRVTRVVAGLLAVGVLAFALGTILVPEAGHGVFSRYSSITPGKAVSTSVNYRQGTISQIPTVVEHYPFGAGLAVAGAAKSFGGASPAKIDGKPVSAESQYNYLALELGVIGLVFWIALTATVVGLSVRGLRRIGDLELRLELAAVFAVFFAFAVIGLGGPTMSSLPFGPFFWFAVGIAAYWFCGGPEREMRERKAAR